MAVSPNVPTAVGVDPVITLTLELFIRQASSTSTSTYIGSGFMAYYIMDISNSAVVGPVAVVVVIAAPLFWVFTLRRRLASSTGSGSSSAHLQHATYGDPRLVQPYMRHSEMDSASPVHLSTSAMLEFNSLNKHSTLSE
ncbi:MAG: hypothetical protein M1813_005508 [Trichoglossum hirsutum]|nr:MAG: hypothetical protein M1813_005508 [Trichoglossum hirsutum]